MLSLVRDIDRLFEFSIYGTAVFDSLSQLRDELKRLMAQFKLA
ncbi:hypothetical protein [Trichlorobacter lovleyi]|nr:hypothetical protein [Trichlorobacter lovleyi]